MTRDEQKKLRELKKALPNLLKEKTKQYPFKKKDYMIWFCNEEMFYDVLVSVDVVASGQCICSTREEMKPLWIDDALWDLLDMQSNKKEAQSLRAMGAFTVSGSVMYQDKIVLENWSIDELEQCVELYLAHFYQTIQTAKELDFLSHIAVSSYHLELRTSLVFLHDEKYQEALDYLSDLGNGVFCNGDIEINEAIRAYCRDKLT